MNTGHAVIQKIVTLLEREVRADAFHHFLIFAAALQGAEQFRGKTRATGQFRDSPAAAHGCYRHDPRDDWNPNAGELTALAEVVEIAVVEEKLRDDVVCAGIDLCFQVIHFHQPVGGCRVAFRENPRPQSRTHEDRDAFRFR